MKSLFGTRNRISKNVGRLLVAVAVCALGFAEPALAARNCSYTISPTSASYDAGGGSGSVSVSASPGCKWTASSSASWITITAGASGNGSGTVSYNVAANTGSSRTGTMTIARKTFTVTQAGAGSCTYSISPTSASYAYTAGTGSVSVTAGAGCSWTATSNASWITITGGASGSGNGTVNYSVAANASTSSRTGTMTIAGQTFTVNQAGAPCSYSISPTSNTSVPSSGGAYSVSVTAGAGCSWTATSPVSWVTITGGASGTGNGTVNYSVAVNTNTTSRSTTLTIAGQSFLVTQAALACSVSISPTSASYGASGGTGSISVTAGAGCSWTASSAASWITITSGSSGTGNGTVNYSVAANTNTTSRTGTIGVDGQTFTVTQAGASCSYSISPTSATYGPAGGSSSVSVTAGAGCSWTASSNAGWITVLSGASGTGNGTVNYSVASNTNTTSRAGTMTIAGQTFTVNQSGNAAPTVSLTAPANGAVVSNTITVAATAADSDGSVTKVEFYVDSTVLIGTDTTSPYSITYDTTALSNGAHTFRAKAFDNLGATGTSSANSVTVSNAAAPSPGAFLWSWDIGGTLSGDRAVAQSVSAIAGGDVVVAGWYQGAVDFGGATLNSLPATIADGFLARYHSDGTYVWAKRLGGSSEDQVNGVAADGSGNVIAVGYFYEGVDFGGGTLTSAGLSDIFVVKYSATGAHLWSKRFGSSTGDDRALAVAVDSASNVVVVGYFYGSVDFGGGALTSTTQGAPDIFVAKYSASGSHIWSKRIGGTSSEFPQSVAVDGSGNVLLAGRFYGTVDFGGGSLSSAGLGDIFVAKYSGSAGAHQWSKRLGAGGDDVAYGVAADSSGNVVVTGSFYGTVDFGGGGLVAPATCAAFAAKYSSTGSHVWSKVYGGMDAGGEWGRGVATDANGNVLLTGITLGVVDFGGGFTFSNGTKDIYLVKLTSAGSHVWSKRLADTQNGGGMSVAADSQASVYCAGQFGGTVNFGGGPQTSAPSNQDAFLAKFAP